MIKKIKKETINIGIEQENRIRGITKSSIIFKVEGILYKKVFP